MISDTHLTSEDLESRESDGSSTIPSLTDAASGGETSVQLNREQFLSTRTLTTVVMVDSDTGSLSSMSFKVEDSHNESDADTVGDPGALSLSPACVSQASTSSKKLEWDSAADVGYQGEICEMASLSAIEKLALGCASQVINGKQKMKRLPKSKPVVESSTDDDDRVVKEKLVNYSGSDASCSGQLANSILNKIKSNAKLPKASSLNELRPHNAGDLLRSVSVGSGIRGHIEQFLKKQGESSSSSLVTVLANGSPKRVPSETNSEHESVKTQVTVVQEPRAQVPNHSTSSDIGGSTSTSSENDVMRRRRRKVKRNSEQTLHDRTRSFEYLPGHVYQSVGGSRQSLNASVDSHRGQADVQNLANQLANSDLIEALVIALKQRLDLESRPVEAPEVQPSCSIDNLPRNCTLTRPIPEEGRVDSANSVEQAAKFRQSDMVTSSFEYRRVRKMRRGHSTADSSDVSAQEERLNVNEQQEGYSSGSVFSGGRGSSSLPSYTATSRQSEPLGDINHEHVSQGGSLVSEQEVRSQLQVCKQLSRHLKGLREYVGQLERTWRALAPPEALTSYSASPISVAPQQVTYSTPTTLSQSITLSIAPTQQSEETTISNVLMHPPPKLVREYASVSIDCHLDRVQTRATPTSRHAVLHRRVGSGSIRSAFAKNEAVRRGPPSVHARKVSVGVNTSSPVAKRRDFSQNCPTPMTVQEREGLNSVGVQTTPQSAGSLKSSLKSGGSRPQSLQASPKHSKLTGEAFFFPLNRNSVIKLRRSSATGYASSSGRSTSVRSTSTRGRQKDEKVVPTLQESLQKKRPDFISRCDYRQELLHKAQEIRVIKSVQRRERLASLASTLGSLESEKCPLPPVNLLAVPKTKMPHFSPTGSQRMFTHKEMRRQTEKTFRRLPEAQQQVLEKEKRDATRANRLMMQIYQKRLQERALKGQVNLTHHQSILTG